MIEFSLISDTSTLSRATAEFAKCPIVAVDTEFFRESTYFAQLCLIQLAGEDAIACIDCVEGPPNAALIDVLFRDDVVWCLHSAKQDLEVVWQTFDRLPARILDTQIAAALAGDAPQISLQAIVAQTLGVELEKGHTRTNWSRRPLPPAAIEYALDDVRHLLPLYSELRSRLDSLGRGEWLEEDCERLLRAPLEPDLATLFTRLKGGGTLRGAAIGAALALLQWRETSARRADRPRRWILSDAALVEAAAMLPTSIDELRSVDSLPPGVVRRSGEAILDALSHAPDAAFGEIAEQLPTRRRPDATRLKAAQQSVRELAAELKIEPDVIASKRDLVAAVLGSPPAHLSSGWRSRLLELPA